MTDFADRNRRLKALDMVAVIDRAALNQKPPVNPHDQAARLLLASKKWSDAVWLKIAKDAGYKSDKTPGPTTRKLVQDVYRGRATAPLENRQAS